MRETHDEAPKLRKPKNLIRGLLLLPVFFSETLLAETSKDIPKAPRVPEPVSAVVTASRVEQPIESLSSSVTVITKEEIEKQKIQMVYEALRNVPGIHLSKFGGPGRQVNVFVRGANANQTLVLVDGVQVNSPTTGDYNFANLTTENIERIEVIRGPHSPLYGSDAMGGVIHIITQKGTPEPRLDSWFKFGTLRTFYEGQDFSGSWKDFSLTSSWSRFDSDGLGENDDFEDTNVRTKFNAKPSEAFEAEFFHHYTNALVGIDDGAFRSDPNRHSKSRQNTLGSTFTIRPFEWWEQKIAGSFFHDMLFSFDPQDPGTKQTESRFKLDTDVYTLGWQHNFSIGEHDTFTIGYEFEHARSNNKRFNKIIRNHGWYLQNLLELWERLYLTVGTRLEDNSAFGFDANPKVGVAYLHHPSGTRLKANFGTAFRTPTLNQLFFPNFGDPSLQPEESIGFDLGVEQNFFSEKAFGSVTYFYNYYDQLIESRPRPELANRSLATNAGKAWMRGIEFEAGLKPLANMEFKFFYMFLEANTIQRREPLIRRPKHSGGLDFNWRLWDRLGWNVNMTVFDERYDSSFATGRPTREINPNFTKIDTTLSFDLTKAIQVYTRIENLNDDGEDENIGFDSPGIQFFGGVKLRLS